VRALARLVRVVLALVRVVLALARVVLALARVVLAWARVVLAFVEEALRAAGRGPEVSDWCLVRFGMRVSWSVARIPAC